MTRDLLVKSRVARFELKFYNFYTEYGVPTVHNDSHMPLPLPDTSIRKKGEKKKKKIIDDQTTKRFFYRNAYIMGCRNFACLFVIITTKKRT